MRKPGIIGVLFLAFALPCFGQSTTISSQMSLVTGGWNIDGSNVISFVATNPSPNTLAITCTENYTSDTNGLLLTFLPTGTTQDTLIDITNEVVGNETGTNWSGFDFYLLTSLNGPAKFTGAPDLFTPPTGYTGDVLTSSNTFLDYTGAQANGKTVTWGSGNTRSNFLQISAPNGTAFTLKQLPIVGNSPTVPEPTSLSLLVIGSALLARRRR